MRRVVLHTTPLGLVSTRYTHPPSLLTDSFSSAPSVVFWLALLGSGHNRSISVNFCICSAHWRFLYFHGQRHARLIRDQSVYDKPKRERSLLITFLSPLLFLAPEVHLREMERLWTDEVIIETVWKSFMSKLLAEWEGVILWVRIRSRNMIGLSVSRFLHSRQ